jgi:hypothetical protein
MSTLMMRLKRYRNREVRPLHNAFDGSRLLSISIFRLFYKTIQTADAAPGIPLDKHLPTNVIFVTGIWRDIVTLWHWRCDMPCMTDTPRADVALHRIAPLPNRILCSLREALLSPKSASCVIVSA